MTPDPSTSSGSFSWLLFSILCSGLAGSILGGWVTYKMESCREVRRAKLNLATTLLSIAHEMELSTKDLNTILNEYFPKLWVAGSDLANLDKTNRREVFDLTSKLCGSLAYIQNDAGIPIAKRSPPKQHNAEDQIEDLLKLLGFPKLRK